MLLFKIGGFVLVVFACYTIGFSKANALKMRCQRLENFQKGVYTLKERIRMNNGEIEQLLSASFGKYPFDYKYLEKEDVEILEDFLTNIGMSDTQSEYDRCGIFISLLNAKIKEASTKYRELSKLYKSLGLWGGIFICIFLL